MYCRLDCLYLVTEMTLNRTPVSRYSCRFIYVDCMNSKLGEFTPTINFSFQYYNLPILV